MPLFSELLLWNSLGDTATASLQMALDEAALRHGSGVPGDGRPLLRIYRWQEPVVTFGYFLRSREICAAFPSGPWLRRWTGGGAVAHATDFTYSLCIPLGHPAAQMSAAESYAAIHRALASALQQLGVPAELVEDHLPTGLSCFQSPVKSDIQLGGKKISGAGQRRCRDGWLHQGTLQLPVIPTGLVMAFPEALAEWVTPFEPPDSLAELAENLEREKYATAAWLTLR
jgi:lipoate-protein ligase A